MKKIVKLTESDLVNIVKKVLNEQLIGTLAGRSAFNLSKSTPKTYAGRTPRVMDDPLGNETELQSCRYKNIHELVNELYDAMNGISFGGAASILIYLEKDNAAKFCRVSNAFKYDNQNLAQWIIDELSLPDDIVWLRLKKHFNELKLPDECLKLNPNYL